MPEYPAAGGTSDDPVGDAPGQISGTPGPRIFALPDEPATETFAARLAQAIVARMATAPSGKRGLHVQLSGDLGAGKTTFVRALLRALGHVGRVKSPTYTLCEPYNISTPNGPLPVYHFDLYRFGDPAEWHDTGFREHFAGDALCLVEWPEKAAGLLGTPDLTLALEPEGDGRRLTVTAGTPAGLACLYSC
ncbi:tRNA threonylcarbamoyladenosine biosynthesis protein TsaE [Pandoraea terrae]|uniref:tRNA threonylcarbamoyladenosine biosynthesis protein TsaE n=1 Tax=Pandoraea terrae TaxID=1537710 RepID=A0A5E4ZDR2_9BURK|nr:tRNA (adenosine(37)-N6)-threonylcarbamoyltransferase complex ATPase subunit type 1 TsaE [Pandoraea terrae]VVE59429.1 tRNA threonylcarbamoyladenosine biosynthesis protein TsaE [Pandoraea terrae]